MPAELTSALSLASPEIIGVAGALLLLMFGVYGGSRTVVAWLAVALLAVMGLMVWQSADGSAFVNGYVNDAFARVMKLLTVIGALVTLAMSMDFAKREKFDMFEFPVLVILATVGMMLMVSANNMLAL